VDRFPKAMAKIRQLWNSVVDILQRRSKGGRTPEVVPQIKLSPQRKKHILDGDETGGGHGPGRGTPGKSEFPATLTDDEVIEGVEEIANNPAIYPGGVIPDSGPRVKLVGNIKGVSTTVIVEPGGEGVITAWPNNVAPNR